MKLLFCLKCGDLFNLKQKLKSCSCGVVKGQYIDDSNAIVNGEGVSIAIGNGSLVKAINALPGSQFDWRNLQEDPYRQHQTSIICWARSHEGKTNPHTKVSKTLETQE